MSQQIFDACAAILQTQPDVQLAQRDDHFINTLHVRNQEGVAITITQLEDGWLSLLAPTIGYTQGLDADMIGQVFEQSWTYGPLRFVLAKDGLFLRADLPLTSEEVIPQKRFLALYKHLGLAVHKLLDHDPLWMAHQDSTPLDAAALNKLLQHAQIEHEYLDKRDLFRLVHEESNIFNPTALELDDDRGLARIIYGLSPVDDPEATRLSPTAAANLLRANDQLQLFKLAYSHEQGGIMLVAELPYSWLDVPTILAVWTRLRLDIMRLESTFGGLNAAIPPIFERLQGHQAEAQLSDATIATALRLIAQGKPLPKQLEAHDDLLDSILELADILFRLLPKQQPDIMLFMPIQVDLVEKGQAPLSSLLLLANRYAVAPIPTST